MASIKSYEKSGRTFYLAAVYVGRDELTGKPRYIKKRGFETKKEATLWASRLTLDANNGDLTQRKNYTFEVVYKEWFASYKNTVRPTTWLLARGMFDNHIIPLLGHLRLDHITTSVLQRVVNKWAAGDGISYKVWFTRTKTVLKYARTQKYMIGDPALGVIVPKPVEEPGETPENFWDRDELATFFGHIDPKKQIRYYTVFRLLAFSGMRCGECLALTWSDVDFTAGTISINKTVSNGEHGLMIQPPKTKAGKRVLAMDATTMAALRRWRLAQLKIMVARGFNANRPEQLLFPGSKNTPLRPGTVASWLSTLQGNFKIEHQITVHGFRHSHASALFAAGATVKEVQLRLGHDDVQTTLGIYTHVTRDQGEQAAEKVANYLNF